MKTKEGFQLSTKKKKKRNQIKWNLLWCSMFRFISINNNTYNAGSWILALGCCITNIDYYHEATAQGAGTHMFVWWLSSSLFSQTLLNIWTLLIQGSSVTVRYFIINGLFCRIQTNKEKTTRTTPAQKFILFLTFPFVNQFPMGNSIKCWRLWHLFTNQIGFYLIIFSFCFCICFY